MLHGVLGLFLDAPDKLIDLLGRNGGALGKLAHFVGDDGEAEALISCLGRLDGRVQGQEVRLLCNVVDDFDNAADVLDLGAEVVDRVCHALDGLLDLFHACC